MIMPRAEPHRWPRMLSVDDAAEYVGVSVTLFLKEVEAGLWPQPVRRGRKGGRKTWDKDAIDAALDRRSGLVAESPPIRLGERTGWGKSA